MTDKYTDIINYVTDELRATLTLLLKDVRVPPDRLGVLFGIAWADLHTRDIVDGKSQRCRAFFAAARDAYEERVDLIKAHQAKIDRGEA